MPRSFAKWLSVPRGRMPRGFSPPARTATPQFRVPSPPPITTASVSERAAVCTAAGSCPGSNADTTASEPVARNAARTRATSCAVSSESTDPAAAFSRTLAFIAAEGERDAEERRRRTSTSFIPPRGSGGASLDGSAPLDDADQHHHDGDDQKDVDEPAEGVPAHHSEQPHDQQDHEDRPEHARSFLGSPRSPRRLPGKTVAW